MARRARIESTTELYHVTMRGNSKQNIFESSIDRTRFLNTMREYSKEMETAVLVYCLMDNHVHMLLQTAKPRMSMMIKKMCDSYTYFFNKKYDRTGALFQERFGSRPIESEEDLHCVIRYILNNPVKAGMRKRAAGYQWSSYAEYAEEGIYCEAGKLLEMVGGYDAFLMLMSVSDENDERVEVGREMRINDIQATEIIDEVMKGIPVSRLMRYPRETRNEYLRVMKSRGLTVRQIERLTGVGRGIVQRA